MAIGGLSQSHPAAGRNGSERLRLHGFLPGSRANGPGARAVIWVQGCSLGCPGCFNPETHSPAGGCDVTVAELFDRICALGNRVEGISLSGGEPLQQMEAVLALLVRVRRETGLTALLFTGFTWAEVARLPRHEELLAHLDVVLAGRYDRARRVARGLRGSANKTLHLLTGRYTAADLAAVPEAEVVIGTDGTALVSGIEPAALGA
jgi:anaerobic ribonucleoside-triphosphate reductase activating protein